MDNDEIIIGDIISVIKVDRKCLKAFPCLHWVTVVVHSGEIKEYTLSQEDIKKLIDQEKWNVSECDNISHFIN